MSLETGRKLGLISSLLLIILPIISIAAFAGFFFAVISSAVNLGSSASVPTELFGAFAGFTISFVIIGVLSIVAIILFVVAMYFLSHYYNERGIFTDVIYAVIIYAATAVAATIVEFAYLIPMLSSLSQNTNPSSIFNGGFFTVAIVLAIVAIIVIIVCAVLVMRALNRLAEKSEVDSFKTAGLLFIIGILLTVVLVGVIIVWIAFIFAAIGFYRLKPLPTAAVPVYSNQPLTLEQKKICPYCGAENKIEALYCKNCGKPI